MTNYKEILRLYSLGISGRGIASSLSCGRNTVKRIVDIANEKNLSWPEFGGLTDEELNSVFYPKRKIQSIQKKPDCEYIHKELAKPSVTLSLLWHEYCNQCRIAGEIPYMYTSFCNAYRSYVVTNKATMRIHRKPSEKLEVDWTGTTAHIINNITGEVIKAYVFVATLPYSGYSYVEAFLNMKSENWITAHVNAYKYFGGVTKILVPDNLRTGVTKIDKYNGPVINKVYQEMAEHYDTVVIPARVRSPRDKGSVEGNVGVISTWILAALRNQQFFSIYELNLAIKEKLEEFNQKPFQKKEGCRESVFLNEEKITLTPLPSKAFELSSWKIATVQFNYHITVDKMHYSVPYEYIKHKVDVRLTNNIVEVFYKGNRIASHPRLTGRIGQYKTLPDHMPDNHKRYLEWNGDRFISWAESIGPNTKIVIQAILASHKIEQQGYKACMGLLKSADKYSVKRLEAACERALMYSPQPTYRSVSTILKTGADKATKETTRESSSKHGYKRGSDYYKGK